MRDHLHTTHKGTAHKAQRAKHSAQSAQGAPAKAFTLLKPSWVSPQSAPPAARSVWAAAPPPPLARPPQTPPPAPGSPPPGGGTRGVGWVGWVGWGWLLRGGAVGWLSSPPPTEPRQPNNRQEHPSAKVTREPATGTHTRTHTPPGPTLQLTPHPSTHLAAQEYLHPLHSLAVQLGGCTHEPDVGHLVGVGEMGWWWVG